MRGRRNRRRLRDVKDRLRHKPQKTAPQVKKSPRKTNNRCPIRSVRGTPASVPVQQEIPEQQSQTTQYFTMPVLNRSQGAQTVNNADDSSLGAAVQKTNARPPPGFHGNSSHVQQPPNVAYNEQVPNYPPHHQIPHMQHPVPMCQKYGVQSYQPSENDDYANLDLVKPFEQQQTSHVMYLRLPHNQIVSIPVCPDEHMAMEAQQMNLDLSYPFNIPISAGPACFVPIQPEMQGQMQPIHMEYHQGYIAADGTYYAPPDYAYMEYVNQTAKFEPGTVCHGENLI